MKIRLLTLMRLPPLYSLLSIALLSAAPTPAQTPDYQFNDSHFHLTNVTQEGPSIRDFLAMMDGKAGRVALFASPFQQQWSYRIDGDHAPSYYLHSDSPI